MAERDLAVLLRGMQPVLHPVPCGFACQDAARSLPGGVVPFAMVAEDEGLTLVAALTELQAAGFVSEPWARISLMVQSDLAAMGLTAAFAAALAAVGISANVIAGFHHDHIFVPWARRDDALAALQALARDA